MDNKNTELPAKKPKKEAKSTPVENRVPLKESTAKPMNTHPTSSGSGKIWGLLFLLLIVTAAAALGGLYLYQQLQTQKMVSVNLEQKLTSLLIKPNQRINQLSEQQSQLTGTLDKQLTQLKTAQTQLKQRVSMLAQRNPNTWRAEEALYLVRLAGRKLWLEHDPRTAASLLKAADERVESMMDPSLTPLRKALSKDISAVLSIKEADISGTALILDDIIDNLEQLPLHRTEMNTANTADNDDMSNSVSDWQTNLAKSWHALIDDFVLIRKRTTDAAPLLEPNQQWYLIENIQNKLLQAQLALYRQDQVNYRSSLALAKKWIAQYFDLSNAKVEDTITTLDALLTLKIETTPIKHFQSMKMLTQVVNYGNLLSEEPKS
ncbi:uroporphyrinogen-III C-methyltransferase [Shewanella surugensis]|uniref:Uroporphyrinogen-III C-methyltransferase n=1 Tax=Shewanella surugensis TaxID=212020 RepID=A0ABT0LG36_9GAMM|nr:uroporphyrinogen-III C-methyltransferase [Shewanella surugensis]MCL1126667.1 uroporphyrinogen-III C-methyltransferase [Shewanella surugensis]